MSDTPPVRSQGLQLDERQRAMLAEMGVRLWWPEADVPQEAPAEVKAMAAVAPVVAPVVPPAAAPTRQTSSAVPAAAPARQPPPVVAAASSLSHLDWAALQDSMKACTACALSQGRNHVVPGVGDTERPDWLVVGEAPGEQEDRQGEPFVGAAGQLLDKMLFAMGLTRNERVFITNVIKCRPPHNRNPEPAEVAQCSPFLQRQIELLQPRIVLAVGRFAAQSVLALAGVDEATRNQPLGKLRGQVFRLPTAQGTVPVVVSYHPAYLLRSPAEKGKAWADLCLAMAQLERAA
jgi:uracil-DNA glycosylase family 4